jgi:hypothetical protein
MASRFIETRKHRWAHKPKELFLALETDGQLVASQHLTATMPYINFLAMFYAFLLNHDTDGKMPYGLLLDQATKIRPPFVKQRYTVSASKASPDATERMNVFMHVPQEREEGKLAAAPTYLHVSQIPRVMGRVQRDISVALTLCRILNTRCKEELSVVQMQQVVLSNIDQLLQSIRASRKNIPGSINLPAVDDELVQQYLWDTQLMGIVIPSPKGMAQFLALLNLSACSKGSLVELLTDSTSPSAIGKVRDDLDGRLLRVYEQQEAGDPQTHLFSFGSNEMIGVGKARLNEMLLRRVAVLRWSLAKLAKLKVVYEKRRTNKGTTQDYALVNFKDYPKLRLLFQRAIEEKTLEPSVVNAYLGDSKDAKGARRVLAEIVGGSYRELLRTAPFIVMGNGGNKPWNDRGFVLDSEDEKITQLDVECGADAYGDD